MKKKHMSYAEQMREHVMKKEILEELAQRLEIKEEEMVGMTGEEEENGQEDLEQIQRMMYKGLDKLEEIRQI